MSDLVRQLDDALEKARAAGAHVAVIEVSAAELLELEAFRRLNAITYQHPDDKRPTFRGRELRVVGDDEVRRVLTWKHGDPNILWRE